MNESISSNAGNPVLQTNSAPDSFFGSLNQIIWCGDQGIGFVCYIMFCGSSSWPNLVFATNKTTPWIKPWFPLLQLLLELYCVILFLTHIFYLPIFSTNLKNSGYIISRFVFNELQLYNGFKFKCWIQIYFKLDEQCSKAKDIQGYHYIKLPLILIRNNLEKMNCFLILLYWRLENCFPK